MTATDRDPSLPPHSPQAEEAVLGAVLKQPAAIATVLHLRPEDFHDPRNQRIWAAMVALHEHLQVVDYHTIADELGRRGEYDQAGGLLYLSELNLATPTAAHIKHYAAIVERTATMRRLIGAAQTVAELAYRDELSVEDVIEQASALVRGCRPESGGGSVLSPEEWASHFLEDLEARMAGRRELISTGFLELDAQIGGFEGGRLYLLMGVPGTGKSELALQIARHVGRRHGRVLFASLEMMPDELAQRWARVSTGIDRNWLAEGAKRDQHRKRVELEHEDLKLVHQAAQEIFISRVHGSFPPGAYTTAQLRDEALEVQASTGDKLALVVTDYLQRFTDRADPKRSDPVRDVGLVAERLKSIARELNVPLLAPVQPNRDYSGRRNKRPILSDLRESGRLEIEADVVIGLYRETAGTDDDDVKPTRTDPTLIEMHMLKNRSGVGEPDGFHTLRWLGHKYGDPGAVFGRDEQQGRHFGRNGWTRP